LNTKTTAILEPPTAGLGVSLRFSTHELQSELVNIDSRGIDGGYLSEYPAILLSYVFQFAVGLGVGDGVGITVGVGVGARPGTVKPDISDLLFINNPMVIPAKSTMMTQIIVHEYFFGGGGIG